MANLQMSPPDINFTDSRRAVSDMGGAETSLSTPANYVSVDALRTALEAVSATYYTSTRLDSMTVNDMVFALRNHEDATSFADYMTDTVPE